MLRKFHSVYAFAVPIIYEVHRLRDGSSFATRRVDAIQKGNVIFTLLASFQVMIPRNFISHVLRKKIGALFSAFACILILFAVAKYIADYIIYIIVVDWNA